MIGTNRALCKNVIPKKIRFFGHVIRKGGGIERCNIEGNRGRERLLSTWACEIERWFGGTSADAVCLRTENDGVLL